MKPYKLPGYKMVKLLIRASIHLLFFLHVRVCNHTNFQVAIMLKLSISRASIHLLFLWHVFLPVQDYNNCNVNSSELPYICTFDIFLTMQTQTNYGEGPFNQF